MKKALALILALVMVLALCACGAKQEAQSGQQYADPYGGYYGNPFDMFRYFFGY